MMNVPTVSDRKNYAVVAIALATRGEVDEGVKLLKDAHAPKAYEKPFLAALELIRISCGLDYAQEVLQLATEKVQRGEAHLQELMESLQRIDNGE